MSLEHEAGSERGDGVLLAVGLVLLMVLVVLVVSRYNRQPEAPVPVPAGADTMMNIDTRDPSQAHFIGSQPCAGCHAEQYQSWLKSHHQLAMQPATPSSVLGDFDDRRVKDGDGAFFFRNGDAFMVRTTGPDGALHDYPVHYTFGVYPLQQYLLGLPGGRLQAFGVAWDSRPADADAGQGGQRWFALYPQSKGQPESPLHWSAMDQNWNTNCAYCHSTGLQKNYQPTTKTFATTYAEVSVGCEACHGPGSKHLAWARNPDAVPALPNRGLLVDFGAQPLGRWHYDTQRQRVVGKGPGNAHREVETCARCHALGTPIDAQPAHGQPIGDDRRVPLLDPALYFVDGQIKGEVFEYGSFIQSRMYHEGVTCSNCHDPHSAKLRAPGNAVCTQCHLASRYDAPQHHHHSADSTGAECIACHMPSRTYMQVDVRHDHSIRVPRPDLSVRLGTPNACNQCHQDRSPVWAAAQIAAWPNGEYLGFQRFAMALHAGREGLPGAREALIKLIGDTRQPAIARATALRLLIDRGEGSASPATLFQQALFQQAARDRSPLVRRVAARWPAVAPTLLDDRVRAVRMSAARTLVPYASELAPDVHQRLMAVLDQYLASLALNAERPETHLELARLRTSQGDQDAALAELETALMLDPTFVPAAVNLADFLRAQGNDQRAEQVLRRTIDRVPEAPALHYALGLLAVRQGKLDAAIEALATAHRLAPNNRQYAYVHALAKQKRQAEREAPRVRPPESGR